MPAPLSVFPDHPPRGNQVRMDRSGPWRAPKIAIGRCVFRISHLVKDTVGPSGRVVPVWGGTATAGGLQVCVEGGLSERSTRLECACNPVLWWWKQLSREEYSVARILYVAVWQRKEPAKR